MPDQQEPPDDPWADDRLLATVAEFPGVGSDASLPEFDRFRAAVSRLVGKRRIATATTGGAEVGNPRPCLFLLHPSGPPAEFIDRCTRVPMLDRGRDEIENRVWFVTHLVTEGHWLEATFGDDDRLFSFVTENLGLGSTPAILYDPRPPGPQLRVYSEGLEEPEIFDELHIAQTAITVGDLCERIDAVHLNHLVAPGVQHKGTRTWKDASKGMVSSEAEDILGGLIAAALQAAFPFCKVRIEQPSASGRLDISVNERLPVSPPAVRTHAILELKVIRGRNSRGNPVTARTVNRWIRDGVVQAAAYRDDRDGVAAALFCFDMRREFTGQECFAAVAELAASLLVYLRVWHLFQTASDYRRYQERAGLLAARAASQ